MIGSSPCFQSDFCERHPTRSRTFPRLLSPILEGKWFHGKCIGWHFTCNFTHLQWTCQQLLANHRSLAMTQTARFSHLSVLLRNGRCHRNQAFTRFPLSSPLLSLCSLSAHINPDHTPCPPSQGAYSRSIFSYSRSIDSSKTHD